MRRIGPIGRTAPLCLAALLLLLALFAGCTRAINRTAERKIRDALPGYIGPARVWNAHVDSPAERTLRGRLGHVTIEGEDVRLKQGLTLAALRLDLRDVEVDTHRQTLRRIGSATFSADVDEAALNDFLQANPQSPADPVRIRRVRLEQGGVTIEAERKLIADLALPFAVTVEPRLASPTRLEFDPDRMSVLGLQLPLPGSVLRWLAGRLDQGFDFSTLPFPLQVASVQVADGRATVSGTADVMKSLNERMAGGG